MGQKMILPYTLDFERPGVYATECKPRSDAWINR